MAKMLWVDKYRPRTLDKVMVHKEEATRLKNLVSVRFASLFRKRFDSQCEFVKFANGYSGDVFGGSDSAGRLSASSVLWTVGGWQEDAHHGIAPGNVWTER